MYLEFFGLQAKPFHTTPDPYFLYLSPSHKQALGSIIYGVKEKKGFIAVTGEVGLGKTTILRAFLAQFDQVNQQTINLFNPNLSFAGVLRVLLCELGHEPINGSDAEVVEQLHTVLIEEHQKSRSVVLLIDEAQNMPVATLEQLRMLTNLETTKDKLIQIVLLGQPELDVLLDRYELRQIRQRIALRAIIHPLSQQESVEYIQHRLEKAGGEGKAIFTAGALKCIVREAKGIPRRLNILCDNALVTSLGYTKNPVTARIAKEVINDLAGKSSHALWKLIPLAAGVLILLLALVALIPLTDFRLSNTPPLEKIGSLFDQGVNQGQSTLSIAEGSNPSNEENVQFVEAVTSVPEAVEQILVDSVDLFPIPQNSDVTNQPTVQPASRVSEKLEERSMPEVMPQILAINDDTTTPQSENLKQPAVQLARPVSERLEKRSTAEGMTQVLAINDDPATPQSENLKRPPVQPAQPVSAKSNELAKQEVVTPVILRTDTKVQPVFPTKKPKSVSLASPLTRIMKKGETLAGLMQEVYGSSSPAMLRFVLNHNSHIVNVRKIYPGEQIVFPSLTKIEDKKKSADDAHVLVAHTGEQLRSSKKIYTQNSVSVRTKSNEKKAEARRTQPYAVVVVQEGDTLEKLAEIVYGAAHPRYIQRILDFNPKILSAKKIFPGQDVVFPRLPEEEKILMKQSVSANSSE